MSDPFMTVFGLGVFYTGLPTKYDTVETTVRNLFYNFSYMHGFLQAKTNFSILFQSFSYAFKYQVKDRKLKSSFKLSYFTNFGS